MDKRDEKAAKIGGEIIDTKSKVHCLFIKIKGGNKMRKILVTMLFWTMLMAVAVLARPPIAQPFLP